MIEFHDVLEDKLISLCTDWVGPGTDPDNYVYEFDTFLHDIEIDNTPFLVATVRHISKAQEGEIGKEYDLYTWEAHIYYIDLDKDYQIARQKRTKIMGKIFKELEKNRRLDNLESVDSSGAREYVYDHSITDVLFDYTAQDEYHSVTSELYIDTFTARN